MAQWGFYEHEELKKHSKSIQKFQQVLELDRGRQGKSEGMENKDKT